MTRHYAHNGDTDEKNALFEDGGAYNFILKKMDKEQGQYGPQIKFILAREDHPEIDLWVWASSDRLGKKAGKASKMRQILNAFFGKTALTEILYFDDDTFRAKYPDSALEYELAPGMVLKARGDFEDLESGGKRWVANAFRAVELVGAPRPEPVGAVASAPARTTSNGNPPKKEAPTDIDPDDVPF